MTITSMSILCPCCITKTHQYYNYHYSFIIHSIYSLQVLYVVHFDDECTALYSSCVHDYIRRSTRLFADDWILLHTWSMAVTSTHSSVLPFVSHRSLTFFHLPFSCCLLCCSIQQLF